MLCVAVIVYGVVALFIVAIVLRIDLDVIKIFIGVVIVRMNCNNRMRYCKRRKGCCNSRVPGCDSAGC